MNIILKVAQYLVHKAFASKMDDAFKRIAIAYPSSSTYSFLILCIIILIIFLKLIFISLSFQPHFSLFEHFDVIGAIVGILGILISLLIAFYVEENHHYQIKSLETGNEIIKNGNEIIKEVLDRVQIRTNEILDRYTSLIPQRYLSQRLKALNSIIDLTIESQKKIDKDLHNSMYILNYNTTYGYLQSFNVSITLKEQEVEPNIPSTWDDYHKNVHKKYFETQERIFDKLLKLENGSVKMALLKTKWDGQKNQQDKFERLLKQVLLGNKDNKVLSYPIHSSVDKFDIDLTDISKGDTYTLPLSLGEDQKSSSKIADNDKQTSNKELLIEKIISYNRGKIKQLLSGTNRVCSEIAFLDYIPFQFFLSVPNNYEKNKNAEQKCLLIFTNILSLQEHTTQTVSFVSENKELIQTLIDIHNTLTKNYKKDEGEKAKIAKLFSCENDEPVFILKNKPDDIEHADLTYLSDYAAYKDLNELLIDHQIPNCKFKFDSNLDLNDIKSQDKTFVVLGLFENKISDSTKYKIDENENCFFYHRDVSDNRNKEIHFIDEIIKIPFQGDNQDLKKESSWNTIRCGSEEELVLIAKVKVGKATLIICGGLHSYGTGIIGQYVRSEFLDLYDTVFGDNVDVKAFAIVYRIPWKDKLSAEYSANILQQFEVVATYVDK